MEVFWIRIIREGTKNLKETEVGMNSVGTQELAFAKELATIHWKKAWVKQGVKQGIMQGAMQQKAEDAEIIAKLQKEIEMLKQR